MRKRRDRTLGPAIAAACVTGMVGLGTPQADAALLFEENFDYGTSDTSGDWGGGWVSAGSNTFNPDYVGDEVLEFDNPPYDRRGNERPMGHIEGTQTGGSRHASLDVSGVDGLGTHGTFWWSSLIRTQDSAEGNFMISLNDDLGSITSNENLGGDTFGVSADNGDLRLAVSGVADGDTVLPMGEVMLLIAKVDIPESGDSTIDLWVFSEGDTIGESEAELGSADLAGASADIGNALNRITLSTDDGADGGAWDALRIGTTAESVIPEPASLALLGAGGLLLLRRRSDRR